MLDDVTKKRINTLRQILVGKLPDPKAQVEQITNGLIYKFMNDMDEQSVSMGGKSTYFSGKFQKYSWRNLMDAKTSGIEKIKLYSEAIEQMYTNENLPELFREIFKNSFLPFKDPSTLNMFLKEINEFNYSHSEKLGDAFEYLLSFMGSQGDAGQFRTPRHIIDFIVEIVNPQKNETILDPACGTAGFLISSYKHILKQNTKKNLGDGLSASERKKIGDNLNGYDISPDMVKMSLVNMYLHNFKNPKIVEYDTLSSEDKWNEYYDVIIANPPFFSPKGGIRPHDKFEIKSKKAEVLFCSYILQHLKPAGRSGIIVPEGVNFNDQSLYVALRNKLLRDGLIADFTLPHGVFKPYASVKTHILILDKKLSKKIDKILFVEIENDGFTQTDTRTPISGEQLKISLEIFKKFTFNPNKFQRIKEPLTYTVDKSIIEKDDKLTLIGRWYDLSNRFKIPKNIKTKSIGESCEIKKGLSPNEKTLPGEFKLVVPAPSFKSSDHMDYEGSAVCIPTVSSSGHGKADIKRVHYVSGKFALADTMIGLFSLDENKLDSKFLHIIISSRIDELLVPLMKGATNVTLDITKINDLKIPYPEIHIQKKIISEVEKYKKTVSACDYLLNNFKPELDTDYSQFEEHSLFDVVDFIRGVTFSKEDQVETKFDGEGILRANNISINGQINFDDIIYVSKLIKFSNDKKLKKDDILICTASGSKKHIGKVAFIHEDLNYYSGGFMGILRVKNIKKILPKFLYYQLNSKVFNEFLQDKIFGANINNLNSNNLKDFKFSIPTLDLQKNVIKDLDNQENIINSNKTIRDYYNKKITDLINSIWGSN